MARRTMTYVEKLTEKGMTAAQLQHDKRQGALDALIAEHNTAIVATQAAKLADVADFQAAVKAVLSPAVPSQVIDPNAIPAPLSAPVQILVA